jgi:hypothetical protein
MTHCPENKVSFGGNIWFPRKREKSSAQSNLFAGVEDWPSLIGPIKVPRYRDSRGCRQLSALLSSNVLILLDFETHGQLSDIAP